MHTVYDLLSEFHFLKMHKSIKHLLVAVSTLSFGIGFAFSQPKPSPERLLAVFNGFSDFENHVKKYDDLSFNSSPQKIGPFSDYVNGLFVPNDFDEKNKYPALIIIPSCAGVKANLQTIKVLVDFALQNKFLAYVLETKRDSKVNCATPFNPPLGRLAKDVLDTSAQLSKLSFVDTSNIFALGESLGAMTALVAGSEKYADRIKNGGVRIKGVISIYGRLRSPLTKFGFPKDANILEEGTNTPILFLAGELDTETPLEDDLPMIEKFKQLKANTFEFKVIKGATHCWDCIDLDGFSKRANNGSIVKYVYSKSQSDEALSYVKDFLLKYKN